MSGNIILIPFAFKEGVRGGVNVSGDTYNTYLKNACVALCSAKHYNPESEVCLATNIKKESLPLEYVEVLEKAGVSVLYVPFDTFVFPNDYQWSLAFYKLCVLKYISEKDYANICYMDTDIYVQGSFEDIWKEAWQNILLYDINHGLNVAHYREICEEFSSFTGERKYITHYGGEFFAASSFLAKEFIEELYAIYNKMIEQKFQTTKGDEFVLSLAADKMKTKIKNAGAYIFRFWTSYSFRLVSTSYEFNRITLLHMPDEKNKGFIKLYDRYIKNGKIPKDKKVWKILRLKDLTLKDKVKKTIKLL